MRLGAMHLQEPDDPDVWARSLAAKGYRAAALPCDVFASMDVIRGFARSASGSDITIAEVGAWGNVLRDSERGTRTEAMERACRALFVADEIGARCAVNIAGSLGSSWDGPDENNLTEETHALIVDTTRQIIDSVKPSRSFYTLEPMPWMYPCDIASQRALIRDIDRTGFGVHFDPVNMILSPQMYFGNGVFLREFIREFGPLIKAVHAKDTLLEGKLTVRIIEVRPGMGRLNYSTLLTELEAVSTNMPLLIEHLKTEEDYTESARYVSDVAARAGVPL